MVWFQCQSCDAVWQSLKTAAVRLRWLLCGLEKTQKGLKISCRLFPQITNWTNLLKDAQSSLSRFSRDAINSCKIPTLGSRIFVVQIGDDLSRFLSAEGRGCITENWPILKWERIWYNIFVSVSFIAEIAFYTWENTIHRWVHVEMIRIVQNKCQLSACIKL